MTKAILTLLKKLLIGMIAVIIIIFAIMKLCKYVGQLFGETYSFLFLILVTIIIGILSNKINKKRILEVKKQYEKEKNKN